MRLLNIQQKTESARIRLLHVALLVAVTATLSAHPVPWGNDYYYLLRLQTFWNPAPFEGDWLLSKHSPEHFVFNASFGVLALFLPIDLVGWSGRILTWIAAMYTLFNLGSHYRIPNWQISASIFIWLLAGQTLVGGEVAVGGFEAKSISYILLFASIDQFLRQRLLVAAALLGLCMSFHPGVGIWAIPAIGIGLVISRHQRAAELLQIGAVTIVFALPGIVPIFLARSGVFGAPVDIWEHVARVHMPWHFDPQSWHKRDILALLLIFIFNIFNSVRNIGDPKVRFLLGFQSALFIAFALGIIWRVSGNYELLKYMPFRLFPLLSLLFFFFHLSNEYEHPIHDSREPFIAVFGLMLLSSLPNLFGTAIDRAHQVRQAWTTHSSGVTSCLDWIKYNTSSSAILIAPPWTKEVWWRSKRAQVANYYFLPYNQLAEWKERVEALGGELEATTASPDAQLKKMMQHYRAMSSLQIEAIGKKYGATLLLTDSIYHFPVAYESGGFYVYLLKTKPAAARVE